MPAVSFFGLGRPTWKNWAHTLTSEPKQLLRPRSEGDVVEIVKQAAREGQRVRAAGSGHSWSPGVPTDGYQVLGEHLTQPGSGRPWVETRGGQTTVRVGPGLTQGQLQHVTQPHGLAFGTMGVVYDIQMGGFVANGCHGTGWMQPTVSDLLCGMRVVLADGSVREFSDAQDAEAMNFARVNLGSIGVITELSFRPTTLFNAHAIDETRPMEDLVSRTDPTVLRDVVTSPDNPYVELFWFPFNTRGVLEGEVWFKHYAPTDAPIDGRAPNRSWDRIEAEFGQAPYYELTFNPSSTPELMPLLWKLVPTRDEYVAAVPDVYHYQHYTFPVTDFSFAIPIIDGDFGPVCKAWYEFVDGVGRYADRGEYPCNVTLHARFIKNSQSLLSPSFAPAGSTTHFCYIEGVTFQPRHVEVDSPGVRQFHRFAQEIGPKWMAHGGRPHWGKAFTDIPGVFEHVRSSYGDNLSRWLAWRDGLDPDRMFWNGFMDRIFEGVKSG